MSSNATTAAAAAAASVNADLPKAVITLGVLGGALVIGLIIAKLADYFYERSSVRDDASDISEHTKELLKTQLELMRMGKNRDRDKAKSETAEEQTARAMTLWSNKVKAKAKLNPIPETGENAAQPAPNATAKAWSEAEKAAPKAAQEAPNTSKPPPSPKAPPTPKSPPKKAGGASEDEEFQVPADIAGRAPKGRAATKNSTILVPANLSKDVNIRPITPKDANSSLKSFSRYNAGSDTPRPTTAKKAKS